MSFDQGNTPFTAGNLRMLDIYGYFAQGEIDNEGRDNDYWKIDVDPSKAHSVTLSFNGLPDYATPTLKLRGHLGQLLNDFSPEEYSGKHDIVKTFTPEYPNLYFDVSSTWTPDTADYTLSVEVLDSVQPPVTEVPAPPVTEVPAPPVATEEKEDTPAPADETNGSGTTIIIEGDNQGDIVVGNNNTNGDNNNVGDNNTNNGVKITEGRRWDKLDGDNTDNIISHAEGMDRMKMTGFGGADTFVLGDYTRGRKLSSKVLDFGNDDIIGFDMTSLGLDDASVTQVSNRREFREATKTDFSIIMWNNSFYSDLNGEIRGLGGGERFAKVQGEAVSLTDLVLTEV